MSSIQQKYWPIINCKFEFQCNQQWGDMARTPFSNIRFCDRCQKEVFLCKTDEQVEWVTSKGLCGAVRMGQDDLIIGMMMPPDMERM